MARISQEARGTRKFNLKVCKFVNVALRRRTFKHPVLLPWLRMSSWCLPACLGNCLGKSNLHKFQNCSDRACQRWELAVHGICLQGFYWITQGAPALSPPEVPPCRYMDSRGGLAIPRRQVWLRSCPVISYDPTSVCRRTGCRGHCLPQCGCQFQLPVILQVLAKCRGCRLPWLELPVPSWFGVSQKPWGSAKWMCSGLKCPILQKSVSGPGDRRIATLVPCGGDRDCPTPPCMKIYEAELECSGARCPEPVACWQQMG